MKHGEVGKVQRAHANILVVVQGSKCRQAPENLTNHLPFCLLCWAKAVIYATSARQNHRTLTRTWYAASKLDGPSSLTAVTPNASIRSRTSSAPFTYEGMRLVAAPSPASSASGATN